MKKMLITTSIVMFLAGLLPVHVFAQGYSDFGDAPDGALILAYPFIDDGVAGSFETCCQDEPPVPCIFHYGEGYNSLYFGDGCDSEENGNGGLCPGFLPYDADECFDDGDAGLIKPHAYTITGVWGEEVVTPCPLGSAPPSLGETCQTASWGTNIDIDVNKLTPGGTAFVNVLIDWNQDGIWGGSFPCPGGGSVPEHVLHNFPITDMFSGLLSEVDPPPDPFTIGPNPGYVWARVTITYGGVDGDWNGSGTFQEGETEDYLLRIDAAPTEWIKIDSPPDLKQQGDSCWMATAANMLAGADYGVGNNVQECAENIYENMLDKFCDSDTNSCPPGYMEKALRWWLDTYGTNPSYANNRYININIRGSYTNNPWMNPNAPRDIGNYLRFCHFVGVDVNIPFSNMDHDVTIWGDNFPTDFPISDNPSEVIVTDSARGIDGIERFTLKPWSEENGWEIEVLPNTSGFYIESIVILSSVDYLHTDRNAKLVEKVTYFENCSDYPAEQLNYTVGTEDDYDILFYDYSLLQEREVPPGSGNFEFVKDYDIDKTITENRDAPDTPPKSITFNWDFIKCGGVTCGGHEVPPGRKVKLMNRLVLASGNAFQYSDISFEGEDPCIKPMPRVAWKVTPHIVSEPCIECIKFITGGYLTGGFKLYSIPGDELISEHRFQSQYSYTEDPEAHTFELSSGAGETESYTVRELFFGHSYVLLDEESLWAFDDWMTVESDQILLPNETVVVNIDWEGQLPYPPINYYLGPADFNFDGNIDIDDFAFFSGCFSGPGVPLTSECILADFDYDVDIDCHDWARFMLVWTGPGDLPEFVPCTPDFDVDGIPDSLDNCFDSHNPLQEDTYPPPYGNSIGDDCECEGDFNCDTDSDGSDAAVFKADFGRGGYNNPCESVDACNGDFDCDNDCDGTDAAMFKSDFGRGGYNEPCPTCEVEEWCDYGYVVTIEPALVTECPEIPTECPTVLTTCPLISTMCPEIPTECPMVPTECPVDPTICLITECPEMPTACPEVTTACPADPTNCPIEPTFCYIMDTDADYINDCYDNCPNQPNGPGLGTCYTWSGMEAGTTCMNDADCGGLPDSCSMNQEDADGDGIGDICEDRFTDNGDGTVTDTHNELVWLKDAGCIVYVNWVDALSQAATLASGTCGLTDGSSAGDWRLPTKTEWEEFYCPQYNGPAVCNTTGTGQWTEGNPFVSVVSSLYWSSTEYDQDWAWCMDLNLAKTYAYLKTGGLFFWPVRDPEVTTTTTTVSSGDIRYTIDFLESGNPGGWTSSFKTFDDSWNMPLSSEVDADIWLNDCPENMVAAGFYMEYDTTRIDVLSVEAYDNSGLSGPWDPSSNIIPDANGPGTYVVIVGNFAGVPPDAGGDIVIAKVSLRLTEPLQTDITFSPIPGLPTVEDVSGYLYDPEIDPKTVSIDIP